MQLVAMHILDSGIGSQLLEITVGNVVAAPVWHRIELDGVGKLHVVKAQEELLALCFMLQRSPCVSLIGDAVSRRS